MVISLVLVVLLVLPLVKSILIIILFYETLLLLSIFILCRVYPRLTLEWVIISSVERLLILFVYILEVLGRFTRAHFVAQFGSCY